MFDHSVRIDTNCPLSLSSLKDTYGITNIETDDPLFGTALSELEPDRVEDIRELLIDSMKKIAVHTVRMDLNDYDAYVRAFRNAARLGIENIKICLCTFKGESFEENKDSIISSLEKIRTAARAFNINILFEPKAKYSFFTNEVYAALRCDNTGIILNPMEYVLAGKGAFLGHLYKYKFKDDIRVIRINDMKLDGTPVLPEMGNGEIKECISAMLARSYDGYFSFRSYSDSIALEDVIACFKKMIKEM